MKKLRNALSALEKNSKDEALAALQKATGNLEILVSRDPKRALTPIDVDVIAHDIYSSFDAIKRAKDEAEDLLEDGKVHKARPLIGALASEIVIRTTNLPLGTYPSAIKAVAPLIDADKVDQAKEALQQALNTLVVTENVIALPLLSRVDARTCRRACSKTEQDGGWPQLRRRQRPTRRLGRAWDEPVRLPRP